MKNIKKFLSLSNEDIVMIVLAFMSFSFGIWTNYRQLWLQSIGFNLESISKLLSVSLICSAIIIFIISFFSTKIKLKNVITMSIILRSIGLLILYFNMDSTYIVKLCILICSMCENIFAVAIYPLISCINKSDKTYKKHVLVNYFSKDFAVVFCGLMIGVTLGKVVFSYNTCLFLTLIATLLAGIVLILYDENKIIKKSNVLPFKKAFKNLFKTRNTNYYLNGKLIVEIAYGLVFGMMMILLTSYIKFNVSIASVFIIVCNIIGSIVCSILNRYSDNLSIQFCTFIKYGLRALMYFFAFLINNIYFYIITIAFAYISTRILDDKVNGTFIRKINTNSQFLFGNIKYFVVCIANGIGIYVAGILLRYDFKLLFLVSSILLIITIFIFNKSLSSK